MPNHLPHNAGPRPTPQQLIGEFCSPLLCFRHPSAGHNTAPGEASPDLLIYGDRIGKLGRLVPACDAVIFNSTGEKLLLTRRTDNGQWCLPGGAMDPGESASECCVREILEETGLVVSVVDMRIITGTSVTRAEEKG